MKKVVFIIILLGISYKVKILIIRNFNRAGNPKTLPLT